MARAVADEIAAAAQVLRALSDRLADDMAVIAAHGDALQQLLLPAGNLVRMHVMMRCQLGQRLLATNGFQCHSGLEGR